MSSSDAISGRRYARAPCQPKMTRAVKPWVLISTSQRYKQGAMSRLSRLAIAVGSWFVLFACATQTNTPPASGLVVSDVTVISPERIAPLEHAYVRIHEGRIAEVSERPLRGEQQLNGEGRFLIPGLID